MLAEPGREAFVQLGPGGLRQSVVGSVPAQQMAEAKGFLGTEDGGLRANQLLANERRQAGCQFGLLRDQRPHRALVERSPFDRAALEDASLPRVELVEASRKQCLNRRWRGHLVVARLLQQRDHLLHEQRVAFRRVLDACAEALVQLREALDQERRLGRRPAVRAGPSWR